MNIYSTTARRVKYPEALTSLREKLGQKVKCEPKFRFYSLDEHLMRKDKRGKRGITPKGIRMNSPKQKEVCMNT